jgi:hypothetical protein
MKSKLFLSRLDRSLPHRSPSKAAQLSQLEALLKLQQVSENSLEYWESSREYKEIHISEISPIEEEEEGSREVYCQREAGNIRKKGNSFLLENKGREVGEDGREKKKGWSMKLK